MLDRRSPRHLILTLLLGVGLTGCPWPWGAPSHAPAPLRGQVFHDGKPAAGVTVRATFTNATPFTSTTPFAVAAAENAPVITQVTTDDQGRFAFEHPPEGDLNLEAVRDDRFKAILLGVAVRPNAQTDVGRIDLKPTGQLVGRVTAPEAPQVTEFTGTDVYIPGTSYLGKTDQHGNFRISNVAAGSFRLLADNRYLGRGEIPSVTVVSDQEAKVGEIPLSLKVPSIDRVEPSMGAAGAWIRIVGRNFGASEGIPVEVKFNGIESVEVERESNDVLRAKVPQLATSGPLVVKVGLIPSISPIQFQVLQRLDIEPAVPLLLRNGETHQFVAKAYDTAEATASNPAVAWATTEAAVGSISSSGVFTASGYGQTYVTVTSGGVTTRSANPVYVSPLYEALKPLGSPFPVEGGVSLAAGNGVAVAVAATYNATASPYRIFAQVLLANATWTALDLGGLGAFTAHPRPCVAWTGTHFELAYWADGSLKVQQLNASSGAPEGEVMSLALGGSVRELSLRHTETSRLLSWIDGSQRVYAYRPGPNPVGPKRMSADDATQRQSLTMAYDGSSGAQGFQIAWQEEDARVMTTRWLLPEPPSPSVLGSGNAQSSPVFAGKSNGVLGVWAEDVGGEVDLWVARRVGGSWSAPMRLEREGVQAEPSLMAQTDGFWLAWQEAGGIFVRKLSDEGLPLGAANAMMVGSVAYRRPAIAAVGTGGVVSWGISGGDSLLSLFAQRFVP